MASKSPVHLTVHKNTVDKRRARTLKSNALGSVGAIMKVNEIRAYAFVALDAKGAMHTAWDTGSVMPMWAFSETMHYGLRLAIERTQGDETWVPPLPLKG